MGNFEIGEAPAKRIAGIAWFELANSPNSKFQDVLPGGCQDLEAFHIRKLKAQMYRQFLKLSFTGHGNLGLGFITKKRYTKRQIYKKI